MMKFGIIVGSHRQQSQSEKVGRFIETRLKTLLPRTESYFFSLKDNPLPFWDEGMWQDDPKWKKIWHPIAAELKSCHAFVVISPEWSGMVPSGLKNFFLLTSQREIGHKPGYIVTVSSGMGGSYPVTELRTSSYKNTRLCYIPEHLIIRHVEDKFGEAPTSAEDTYLRERLDAGLKLLKVYADALGTVRESGAWDFKKYPNGL